MSAPPTASSMNHVAYLTEDMAVTHRFYTEVLGFPLVAAVRNDYDPEADAQRASLHTFYAMTGGEVIAFFEIEGIKRPPAGAVPTWARHFAMNVASRDELDAWRRRLRECGVGVTGVVDHDGTWQSIYFMDPNEVLLEFTHQTRPLTAADADEAQKLLRDWLARR